MKVREDELYEKFSRNFDEETVDDLVLVQEPSDIIITDILKNRFRQQEIYVRTTTHIDTNILNFQWHWGSNTHPSFEKILFIYIDIHWKHCHFRQSLQKGMNYNTTIITIHSSILQKYFFLPSSRSLASSVRQWSQTFLSQSSAVWAHCSSVLACRRRISQHEGNWQKSSGCRQWWIRCGQDRSIQEWVWLSIIFRFLLLSLAIYHRTPRDWRTKF